MKGNLQAHVTSELPMTMTGGRAIIREAGLREREEREREREREREIER